MQTYHHGDEPPGDEVQLRPGAVGPRIRFQEHHPVVNHHDVPERDEGRGKVMEVVSKVGEILKCAALQNQLRPGLEPELGIEEELHPEEGKEVVDDDEDAKEAAKVLEQVKQHGGDLGQSLHVGDDGEEAEDHQDG